MSKKLKAGKKAVVGGGHPEIAQGSIVRLIQCSDGVWLVRAKGGDHNYVFDYRMKPFKKKKKPKAQEVQEGAYQQERSIVVRGFGAITRSQAESIARQRLVDLVDEATFDNWIEVDRLLRVGALQPFIDALATNEEVQRNVTTE